MALINFNKINVAVNGSYIMCDTASLAQQGQQKPLGSLNSNVPYDYTPTTLVNSLSLSYNVEPNNDPNYSIISAWKSDPTTNTLANLSLGNVNFVGYLSSYGFALGPNQQIKAKASFDIFNPITSNFSSQSANNGNLYNLDAGLGTANYCTAYLYAGANKITDNNIVYMDYSINFAVTPIYTLSQIYPSQVMVLNATETINTISETQINSTFSGKSLSSLYNGIDTLKVKNINPDLDDVNNEMSFAIGSMKTQTNKVDISVGNLILFNSTFSQSY